MSVQETLETKLAERFDPAHLEVTNESGGHNVPAGSETHFKVVLVADEFEGQGRVARHRLVNGTVRDELAGPIHALAIHAYTRDEWHKRFGEAPMSPPCLGGKAAEHPGAPTDSR